MSSCHLTEDQNYCKRWHDGGNDIQGYTVAHNCNVRTWESETEGYETRKTVSQKSANRNADNAKGVAFKYTMESSD